MDGPVWDETGLTVSGHLWAARTEPVVSFWSVCLALTVQLGHCWEPLLGAIRQGVVGWLVSRVMGCVNETNGPDACLSLAHECAQPYEAIHIHTQCDIHPLYVT